MQFFSEKHWVNEKSVFMWSPVTWRQDPEHCSGWDVAQDVLGDASVSPRICPSRILNLEPTRELILLRTSSGLQDEGYVSVYIYKHTYKHSSHPRLYAQTLTCTDIWGSSPGKTTSFPSFLHSTSAIGKAKTSHKNTALLPVTFTKSRGGTLMTGTSEKDKKREKKESKGSDEGSCSETISCQ